MSFYIATNSCLSRQTYFLSRQNFSRNKYVSAINVILSRQKFCRDKLTFVSTNTCLSRQNFCRRRYRDKIMFVVRKVLSRQKYFCREKTRVCREKTRICWDKTFVTTKMVLVAVPANDTTKVCLPRKKAFVATNKRSRQKHYLSRQILLL